MHLTVPINVKMDMDEIVARLKEDDFVQVVRCKDCKYATGWTTKYGLYGGLTCEQLDRDVDDEFFCSYSERRDDG